MTERRPGRRSSAPAAPKSSQTATPMNPAPDGNTAISPASAFRKRWPSSRSKAGAVSHPERLQRQIRIVQPLIVAPALLYDLAGGPIFAARGALGLDAELLRPLAERIAVPRRLRLERRQAELLPNLLCLLHVLAGRQRERRVRGPGPWGDSQRPINCPR